MGETDPPGAVNADSTRGVPYYEKLKRDLRETLTKKKLLDKNMAALEEQIYRYEGAYLEETGAGNIVKGFDNYVKGSTTSGTGGGSAGGASTRRKATIVDQDRLFSRSSASFMREVSPDSSNQNTPSQAPTPTSTNAATGPLSARGESNHPTPTSATSTTKAGGGGGAAGNKKGRKGGPAAAEKDDEESEGKQPKRLKITYARGGFGEKD